MKTLALCLLVILCGVNSQNGDKITLNFNFGEIFSTTTITEPSEAAFPPLLRETIPPSDLMVTMEEVRVTTLPKILTYLNLTSMIKNTSNFVTVFAPTDGAFSGVGLADLLLPQNLEKLSGIVGYHVVQGKYTSAQLSALSKLKTLQGEDLQLSSNGLGLFVNGVGIKQADVAASNGVVHVLREVLTPPSYRIPNIYELCGASGKNFTYLLQYSPTVMNLLRSAFVNLTLFCPLDEAFSLLGGNTYISTIQNLPAASLTQFLSYYILPTVWTKTQLEAGLIWPNNSKNITTQSGDRLLAHIRNLNLRVDEVLVREFNIAGYNGLVHVIDRVLMAPPFKMNLLQTATSLGLTAWVALVRSAPGLEAKILQTGPYTFFIPNNQALSNLNISAALAPTFVLYATVGGSYDIFSLPKNPNTLPTEAGGVLTFTTTTNTLVNNATIVSADIPTLNGMIHIVNAVIVPPSSLFATPTTSAP